MDNKYFTQSNLKNLNVKLRQNKNIIEITPDKETRVLLVKINDEPIVKYEGNTSITVEVPNEKIKSELGIYAGKYDNNFNEENDMIFYPIYISTVEKNENMKQLEELGIKYTNIYLAEEKVQTKAVKTISRILKKYPELKDFVRILWIEDLGKSDAKYTSKMTVEGLYGKVTLNSNKYLYPSNEDIAFLEYTIFHEFGHALLARLALKKLEIAVGDESYENWISHLFKTTELAQKIILMALNETSLTYMDIRKQVSKYAAVSFDECFAESIGLNLFGINSLLIYEIVRIYKMYR